MVYISVVILSLQSVVIIRSINFSRGSMFYCFRMISKCKKIGEGVYGEVFRAVNSNGDSVAIKVWYINFHSLTV